MDSFCLDLIGWMEGDFGQLINRKCLFQSKSMLSVRRDTQLIAAIKVTRSVSTGSQSDASQKRWPTFRRKFYFFTLYASGSQALEQSKINRSFKIKHMQISDHLTMKNPEPNILTCDSRVKVIRSADYKLILNREYPSLCEHFY